MSDIKPIIVVKFVVDDAGKGDQAQTPLIQISDTDAKARDSAA